MEKFYIGIDGGASKSLIRLEDEAGQLLSEVTSGPANIRCSVSGAWESIDKGLATILASSQLSLTHPDQHFYLAAGLAGCEIQAAQEAFCARAHPFKTLLLFSDAEAALAGAHAGQDGVIIIAGTGIVGLQSEKGQIHKVGGWGFPHDDIGSGAWLGLEAMRLTFPALDGRAPASPLTQAIFAHFHHDQEEMINWANCAQSKDFASLAPIMIDLALHGEENAIRLLKHAASAIDQIAETLAATQTSKAPLPCALLGGIASHLQPYLGAALQSRLRPPLLTADAGAILLLRRYLKEKAYA
jgi:glucosamine kinase